MRIDKLKSMLELYPGASSNFEVFIHECNREGLISTSIDYEGTNGSIYFSAEAQVGENLIELGQQLKNIFQRME